MVDQVDSSALTNLLEPQVEALGFRLVRVALIRGTSDPTLQVMAERPDTRQLDLGDCERISRRLSEVLDAADPIDTTYRLEVSSPGIDRPLTRAGDYVDWAGHEARITLLEPTDGRKQYSGTIAGLSEGETVELQGKDGNDYSIPLANVANAKLLLTDKLIKATAPLSTEGADSIQTVED